MQVEEHGAYTYLGPEDNLQSIRVWTEYESGKVSGPAKTNRGAGTCSSNGLG